MQQVVANLRNFPVWRFVLRKCKDVIAFLTLEAHFCRLTRKTFDTSETKNEFGPIRIEFGKVQSKVSLKYDSWHKDVLSKFGNLLGNKMTDFHTSVSKVGGSAKSRCFMVQCLKFLWKNKCFLLQSRGDLEQQSIETSNTSEAVGFITYVQSLKRKMKNWEKDVEVNLETVQDSRNHRTSKRKPAPPPNEKYPA